MDVDKTPTKPKAVTRSQAALPTPPSSSPFRVVDRDVQGAADGIESVHLKNTRSRSSSAQTEETDTPRQLNPYKLLKFFLRLSASNATTLDQTVIGRDEEKATLHAYIASDLEEVGMYVSGPPGTGKTATVTAIGRNLLQEGWQVVELGCMSIKVGDIWKKLGEALECGRTEKDVTAYIKRGTKV
jgi:cell division control protein 6